MYDQVLIPTDGNEGIPETLRHGLDLADRHGATVHALSVVDRRQYLGAPDDTAAELRDELTDGAQDAVADVAERAHETGVEVVTEVVEGIPHKAVLEYVEAADVDAIVMGTRGRTARERGGAIGSVTERVVKQAPVPVLVVNVGDAV